MFSFLKVKKQESRGFKYKPRYFDAEKEVLLSKIQEKEKTVNSEGQSDNQKEMLKMRIRDELSLAKANSRRDMRGLWQGGNLRLIAIIIGLIGISYFILHRFLPVFLSMLFPNG